MERARVKSMVAVGVLFAATCSRATPSQRHEPAASSPPATRVDPPPPAAPPRALAQDAAAEDLRYLDPSQDPEIERPAGPRCPATVATCLPIPYGGDPQLRVGERAVVYDPNAQRRAVKNWTSTDRQDRCKHDGDCVVGGCGNSCVGWQHDVGAGICQAYGELREAYCGCLAGFCGWFTQPGRPAK